MITGWTKSALRQEMRARLRARSGASVDVSDALCTLPGWNRASIVAGYQPIRGEISVVAALDGARARGAIVVLPRLENGLMIFRRWRGEQLESSTLGIPEPPRDAEAISFADVDVALVPGVAFDRDGRRLGQGGGYYDRVLAERGGIAIGVCWAFQVTEVVPVEGWDQDVDGVLTERGWVRSPGAT